jgi:hypothetical protein
MQILDSGRPDDEALGDRAQGSLGVHRLGPFLVHVRQATPYPANSALGPPSASRVRLNSGHGKSLSLSGVIRSEGPVGSEREKSNWRRSHS